MTLADLLEKQFRPDLRYRGDGYFADERVSIARVTPDRLFGAVRDGIDYETQLDRADGKLKKHCSCEQFAKLGVCKHLWATIRAVDGNRLLTGVVRPGYVPPFVADVPVLTEGSLWDESPEEPWDIDEPAGATGFASVDRPEILGNTGGASGTQLHANGSQKERRVNGARRPWEKKLESLRGDLQDQRRRADRRAAEREIFYEIDLPASRKWEQLVIQVSQRQRRASGQWGKMKPLKLRPGHFDELDLEDDRTILSYLYGGTPDRAESGTINNRTNAPTVYRYVVAHELCDRLLPLICQTGRARYLGASRKQAASLRFDDDVPWELALRVAQRPASTGETPVALPNTGETLVAPAPVAGNGAGKNWHLESVIMRGEQSLPPEDIQLLLPGGFVLTEEAIARLDDYHAFGWVRLLSEESSIEVPDGQEEDLVDRILEVPALPRLVLPESLRLEEVRLAPGKRLVIEAPSTQVRRRERLAGRVRFDYEGEAISGSSDRWAIVHREEGRCLLRDRPAEAAAWVELQEQGFRRRLQQEGDEGPDVEVAARDLGPAVRALMECGWDISAGGAPVRRAGKVGFRVQSGIDWFELHADLDFGGQTIAFPELLAAISRGETTVRLDDGSLGVIPEEWAKEFGIISGLGSPEEDHLRFAPNQVALLDALLAAKDSVQFDEPFADLTKRFRDFEGVTRCPEPEGFQGELRSYQQVGLGWLRFLKDFRLGGCLADDMGLGKTVQLLALLEYGKHEEGGHLPSLVVVPKSLMFNWARECARFTPDIKALEYVGGDREALRERFSESDLVITTYGTLRRDILHLKEVPFQYVVLDEAQAIKNSSSQVARAARLLQGRHRIALSGTPIENHLGDLWSIFEFLNPGMLGRSSLFRSLSGGEGEEENRRMLARAMRPFILRRTKTQVASDLPEKFEETIYCDMTPEQNTLYTELRDHYRQSLLGVVKTKGLAKNRMHVLEALLRLRQAACHPALLGSGEALDESAKLDALLPQLDELIAEGHKALVFSQFTSMLAIVRAHLDRAGIIYEYLDGQTTDRERHVQRFQEDEDCPLFLISLKAGGLGLNLTSADYVFLLDPWWNPAVENQAIDRAHRLGQTRHVFAYRMIVRGTVEEKIAELQTRKRRLADGILEADAGVLQNLSSDDLELLLS